MAPALPIFLCSPRGWRSHIRTGKSLRKRARKLGLGIWLAPNKGDALSSRLWKRTAKFLRYPVGGLVGRARRMVWNELEIED